MVNIFHFKKLLIGVASEVRESFLGLVLALLTVVEATIEVGDTLFGGGHVLLETTPRVGPSDAEVNSSTTNVVSAAIEVLMWDGTLPLPTPTVVSPSSKAEGSGNNSILSGKSPTVPILSTGTSGSGAAQSQSQLQSQQQS